MTERADADPVKQQFLAAKAADLGVSLDIVGSAGTTVVPDPERQGSRGVACYQVVEHAVLSCDPGVADQVAHFASNERALSDADFRAWSEEQGATIVGDSVMRLQRTELPELAIPGSVHVFDWSRSDDLELMQAFVDTSDDDDLDEAEVAMDELDDQAVALRGDDGRIMAYASSRPYEDAPAFGDIGVIVASDARRGGWGRAVVATLITDILEPAGVIPLYRCSTENLGSYGLSTALGFESALSLSLARMPEGEK